MRTSSRLSQTPELFGRIGDKMKLADDEHAAVAQVLTEYYRAFSTLDAQAVGPTSMSHRSWSAQRVSCRRRHAPPWPPLFNDEAKDRREGGELKSSLTG